MRIGDRLKSAAGYMAALAGFGMRSPRAFGQPVSVMIEPTNLCNLRCPLCATGSGMLTRPSGCMSLDQFRTIMAKLPPGIENVYLWGQGEPFLAPDFLAMVSLAADAGRRTIVSTNGHFLDDPAAIIGSGMHELIISLDGADRETYESYRTGGDFDQVIGGAEALVREKKRLGRGPVITFQHLITRRSEGSLDEFRRLAERTGADRVVFKTLQAAFSDDGADYLPVNARFSRYERREDGNIAPRTIPFLGRRCLRLYHSFQVDWQGNVLPCCFDKNSDVILGNLIEMSWEDIWNGERYRGFRRGMNEHGRTMAMCRDCTEGLRGITVHV